MLSASPTCRELAFFDVCRLKGNKEPSCAPTRPAAPSFALLSHCYQAPLESRWLLQGARAPLLPRLGATDASRPEGYAGSLDSPVRPVSLLQTRGPQAAPLQATFVRSGAFWTWWLAFRGARLRGDVSDDDLSSSSISKAGQAIAKSSQQQFHCKRQRRNRLGTSRVVSTTLHDRKNASAATRGNKSCILRPREAAAAPGRGARACSDKAMRSQPAPRAGTAR